MATTPTLQPGQFIDPNTGQPVYEGQDPNIPFSQQQQLLGEGSAQYGQQQSQNQLASYEAAEPASPAYQGMTNPDGSLRSAYAIQSDNAGLNGLEQRASEVGGTSPWAQMTLAKQATDQNTASSQAAATAAGNTAGAMSSLETTGGMTGGARERVATQGARNANAGEQAVAGQGADARMSIGIQDEQNRQSAQSQLAGYDQADKTTNTQNTVGANQAQNAYNMTNYGNQINAWAGATNAAATANSGKK